MLSLITKDITSSGLHSDKILQWKFCPRKQFRIGFITGLRIHIKLKTSGDYLPCLKH